MLLTWGTVFTDLPLTYDATLEAWLGTETHRSVTVSCTIPNTLFFNGTIRFWWAFKVQDAATQKYWVQFAWWACYDGISALITAADASVAPATSPWVASAVGVPLGITSCIAIVPGVPDQGFLDDYWTMSCALSHPEWIAATAYTGLYGANCIVAPAAFDGHVRQ